MGLLKLMKGLILPKEIFQRCVQELKINKIEDLDGLKHIFGFRRQQIEGHGQRHHGTNHGSSLGLWVIITMRLDLNEFISKCL